MPRFGRSDPARVLAQNPALLAALDGHWVFRDGAIDIDDATWSGLDAARQQQVLAWIQACGLSSADQAPAAVVERTGATDELRGQYVIGMGRLAAYDAIGATATPAQVRDVVGILVKFVMVLGRLVFRLFT